MLRLAVCSLVALTLPMAVPSAQQSWTGTVSDSSCREKHEPGGEAGLPDAPSDCTLACVRGGSKFVFVTDDHKVFLIAKQDDPALPGVAATKVRVTGALENDVLTIAKIEAAK